MNNQYSIVWQQFNSDSNVAIRFWVDGKEGYLPFFIEGENLKKLERNQKIELDEYMLLRGILVGLNDINYPFKNEVNDKLLLSLLPVLQNGFGIPSLEMMILDVAFNLKQNTSLYSAYSALKNGLLVETDSSMIRSDLINTIWELWEENPENGYKLMEEVIENFYKIDLEAILPGAIEMIVYTTFVAIYFKKNDLVNEFLEKYVIKYIEKRVLKSKIKILIENKDSTLEKVFWK